ncbi:MAG: ABC transporter ATP-binding protein [Candidatus Hodarchaeota archaeon]
MGGRNLSSLTYSNVSFGYSKDQPILKNINLDFHPNEIVGIIGPNGAGKTTLLKLANGLLRPHTGKIFLGGKDIRNFATSQLAQQILVTFQFTRQQFFTSTVEKEVMITLDQYEKEETSRLQQLEKIIERLELTNLRNYHPYILSGGEQRRLAIALAMASSAKFFFLDEPTANLDQISFQLLMVLLREMRNQGSGIVIVSHDLSLQLNLCDKLIVLINGIIDFSGTPIEVIKTVESRKWDFLDIPEIYSFIRRLDSKNNNYTLLKKYLACESLEEKTQAVLNHLEKI